MITSFSSPCTRARQYRTFCILRLRQYRTARILSLCQYRSEPIAVPQVSYPAPESVPDSSYRTLWQYTGHSEPWQSRTFRLLSLC
eukprot:3235006-Rhodomonas_salina.1